MSDMNSNLPSSELSADERNWAALAHLSALVNLVGIPSPVGPLLVWLFKKSDSAFIAQEAKASLNFALSVWLYGAAFLILAVLGFLGSINTGFVLSLLLLIVWLVIVLLNMIFSVVGAIKASNGEVYDYPFSLKLIK